MPVGFFGSFLPTKKELGIDPLAGRRNVSSEKGRRDYFFFAVGFFAGDFLAVVFFGAAFLAAGLP